MEKIIHQIWIGPYKIPAKEKIFCEKIRAAHPDFSYIFWNNDNFPILDEHLVELVAFYESKKQWVNIADLLRYWIVREYGGVYIDADYELIKSIHDFDFDNIEGIIPLHFNPGETICNSIFGFNKKHPLMEFVVSEMKKLAPNYNHWLGPHFFGRCIKQCLGFTSENLDIEIFQTLNDKKIVTPHSRKLFQKDYMKHHLSYNWHVENQKKLEEQTNYEKSKFKINEKI
jgi:hypothetical protein